MLRFAALSISAELMDPFALDPIGGDFGLPSLAETPFKAGTEAADPRTGPSEDLRFRVA